jgi:hypothetical protein
MFYTVTVKFQANRKLTDQETEALLGSIELQIQEPQDLEGEGVEYATVLQEIEIEGEGEGK